MTNLLRGVALLAAAAAAAAAAFAQTAALVELDRAGRAIAAQPCKRPLEQKISQVGSTGDEMHAIDCGSFRIARYVAGERQMPMALVVLGPGPELPLGIMPNMSVDDVVQRLGPPARRTANGLNYLLDPARPGGDRISFEIEADRVRAVSWSWRVEDR